MISTVSVSYDFYQLKKDISNTLTATLAVVLNRIYLCINHQMQVTEFGSKCINHISVT